MVQVVSHSPSHHLSPEFAFQSLRVGFMVDNLESGWVFLRVPSIFHFHKFHSTLISFILFNFICHCDGASGIIGQHPWYSQTFNKGASSRLLPRTGPMSEDRPYLFIIFSPYTFCKPLLRYWKLL